MEHGVGGNAWIMDRNIKHKLRALTLSLLEEDNDIPGVLTPARAAKEAAKEDQLVNAARAKIAEFVSRAAAPAPGAPAPPVGAPAPPPAQAFVPQDSSPARALSVPAQGP